MKLSHQQVTKIEDPADFRPAQGYEESLTQAATKLSEARFASVWNNEEDAAYDRL